MSTDDVTVAYEGECNCGAGTFRVMERSPDHPYVRPSQTTWEPSIECDNCRTLYVLLTKDADIILANKPEVEQQQENRNGYWKKRSEVEKHARENSHFTTIAARLDMLPSMAAIYRKLNSFGVRLQSLATFRTHFNSRSSTEQYIAGCLDGSNLLKALHWADIEDKPLEAQIGEETKLQELAQQPIEVIKTVYKTHRY